MEMGMDTGMGMETGMDTGMGMETGMETDTGMAAGGQPRLWEQVCAEYEAEQPPFPDVPESKCASSDGGIYIGSVSLEEVSLEAGMLQPAHMEQSYSAPAADPVVQQLLPCPEPPDPKTCSPREYLEYYVFPVLLPGLAELLHQAEKEKCFERKRTKFIACDFLTEWLYNKNLKRKDESFTEFFSIPFVSDWLKDQILDVQKQEEEPQHRLIIYILHPGEQKTFLCLEGQLCLSTLLMRKTQKFLETCPRPPIPLSLLLSEEEASLIIQSFWRGYRVRCDSEIQELRQWQKQLREERNIKKRVKEFWAKQEAKVGSKLEDSEEHEENH